MKKKYFFFDIDGTLTDRATNQVISSARKALEQLQRNGHEVAIATGRAHYKARKVMEDLSLKNMVCSGGAGIVVDGKLIKNSPLELEKAKEIILQAEELGYGILLALDDSINVYAKNNRFREVVGDRKEPTEYVIDTQLDFTALTEVFKIYLAIPDNEEHLLDKKDLLGNLRFVPDYLMFQHDDKKRGIIDMMNIWEAPIEDVVVFGDDLNDLVMFDPAWMNIAMGNAVEGLKAKADYITDPNIHDGIYKACKKFGWI
ncbi:MAG TPA: Cof-type HAD-IIB family hydrolase [Candidatus Jeotgalibaca pullicola]|nr:Cof-type HAD-IIB family hydrolase [Candidatus Jeotgalibaca pullicola]